MKSFLLLCAAVSLVALPGCGGGPAESTGRLSVRVAWPEPSRLIPAASNSIKIEVFDGSSRVAFRTINRPASETTFTGLPVANLQLKATAYPEDPGDPPRVDVIAQASGSIIVPVQAGDNSSIGVTMSSTIDAISVTAATLVVNGPTQTLNATARDGAGNVVLLTPSALEWTSGDTGVVTVTSAGVVTAVTPGVALITARDTESNKSGSAPVTVSAQGGTVTVIVDNPPSGTRSVRIEITNAGQTLASRNLAWTSGANVSDVFTGVPAGSHTVSATAFSQDSGGGSALGSASIPLTLPSLGSATVTLPISSLVASLALAPPNPVILQGQSATLTVQALDASATPIATLISSGFTWETVPNPSGIASVNGSGLVSALTPGTVAVRATDLRTGQFAQTNVTVTPNSASAGGVVR